MPRSTKSALRRLGPLLVAGALLAGCTAASSGADVTTTVVSTVAGDASGGGPSTSSVSSGPTRSTSSRPSSSTASSSSSASTATGPTTTTGGVSKVSKTKLGQQLSAWKNNSLLGTKAFTAMVVDPRSGTTLYSAGHPSTPVLPASTQKLLVAAAVLTTPGLTAQTRLSTTVVRGQRAGDIVLVGGGDVTLSAAGGGHPTVYTGAATVAQLAQQLQDQDISVKRILVDTTAWTGPDFATGWSTSDIAGGNITHLSPLMVDGDRTDPSNPDSPRTGHPATTAAAALAEALGEPDLPVVTGQRAPAGAPVLAKVQSAPLGTLLKQMLVPSDNVLAEALGRLVAQKRHQPASFTGVGVALRAALTDLKIDDAGVTLDDASGLSDRDRIPIPVLTAILSAAVTGRDSRLAPLPGDLPVAGRTGTLTSGAPYFRYTDAASAPAKDHVHAKTGSLESTYGLAGFVTDQDGDLLVFALNSNGLTVASNGTRRAQDDFTADLRTCGCR